MRISIFILFSFAFLFSSIDDLIGDFDSEYNQKPKKITTSKSFNKNVVMEKKMSPMKRVDKVPTINRDIKNQKYANNQEDILKVIDDAIGEYMGSLAPFIIVVSLFVFLILIMYVIVSAANTATLKHKISVLEDILSNKFNDLETAEDEEYDFLLNENKKINLRVSSLESLSKKMLLDAQNSNPSQPDIKKPIKQMIKKRAPTKKQIQEQTNIILDDDSAMDAHDDEGLSLDYEKKDKVNKGSKPLSDLSNLDMNIDTRSTSGKKNKPNIKEMEKFSMDDFDE